MKDGWVPVPLGASLAFLEVAPPALPTPPARGQLEADSRSFKDGAGPVLAVAAAGVAAALSVRKARRARRVARRFRDEGRNESELDWSAFNKTVSQMQAEREAEERGMLPEASEGWSSFQRLRPAPSASGKLNAELANGRLALLSASRQPAPAQARALRAEPEEIETEIPADVAMERKKFDLKELPSDEGYGWNPDEVEKEKPFQPSEVAIGVTEPLGFFDPLGFAKIGDFEGFRFKRAAELKHGRVAMMASVGFVVQHFVKLPGFELAGSDWVSTFNTMMTVPALYQFSILMVVILFLELSIWAQEESREPGDFGDPFGLGMYTAEMRNRELNNGRFAMFATMGIIAAQNYTGKDAIEQLGL
ncbi:unnamed protein product [Effrenium voratum]|nr:unnamed protein product [Effrenium voratum]